MKKILLITLFALLGMIQAVAQEDTYLPLVREGVKWVNEKVIINNGDTTSYYYTYEFKGIDEYSSIEGNAIYQACYYYTGEILNIQQDSLIAGLRNVGEDGYYEVYSFRNNAYDKIFNEQRNMLSLPYFIDEGPTRHLYWFGNPEGYNRAIRFFIMCQESNELIEPFLTYDNFTNVDPIKLEGTICNRCAYVNELGDTMCYVVEGIGFDSYDMGDLLTPFTRKPNPNADYQEYCGLSHVIKDGKIIYKGMRFNPNAIVIPGDVDGDGEITISDANSVIDIVVMGGNAGHTHSPAADANGDGEITIADVNAIVNLIQGDN